MYRTFRSLCLARFQIPSFLLSLQCAFLCSPLEFCTSAPSKLDSPSWDWWSFSSLMPNGIYRSCLAGKAVERASLVLATIWLRCCRTSHKSAQSPCKISLTIVLIPPLREDLSTSNIGTHSHATRVRNTMNRKLPSLLGVQVQTG
jgi:hypothetical protein